MDIDLFDVCPRFLAETEADEDTEYCLECRNTCTGSFVDCGIGSYEFWGQKGVDTRMEYSSDCCGATVIKNGHVFEGNVRDEDDYGDYLYERQRDDEASSE